MTELTRRDRLQALAMLEAMADELGLISTWLSKCDEDKAAITLEDAHKSIAAAAWALSTPLRHHPEGWLSPPRQPGQPR
jgi:hypothetical protein